MNNGLLVSVVDDDPSIRDSIPHFLRASGYDAHAFASAEAFLASQSAQQSRCLILDIAMPGMSGPDLFTTVRQRPIQVPVIFITAHGTGHLCQELIDQGAAACLHKPFEPTDLLDALRAAVPDM